MNLRTLFLGSSLLMLAPGCVDDQPPIRITDAFVPTEDCAVADVHSTAVGIDAAVANSAVVGFNFESDLEREPIQVDGHTLAGPETGDMVFDTINLSYSTDAAVTLESATRPIYFYAHENAGEDSWFALDLLTSQSAEALGTGILAGEEVDVIATWFLTGQDANGNETETRPVNFPIRVYNSGFAGCAAGETVVGTGPCGTVTRVACEAGGP